MSGGDAVVAGLRRWGVDTVFGVPGVQLDHLFDSLYRTGKRIRTIHTRHEQGAAYMAFGYAAVTDRPGVCIVVPGPGLLNAGAALATAYACNARVVCLTSTVNSALIGLQAGALHDINGQDSLLRNLTKWSARANHVSEIPGLVDEAFRQVMTGRPRPVALEVPPDILAQTGLLPQAAARPTLTPPLPDPEMIERAAALCARAERPVIVVGGGALSAGPQVQSLAELLQAPVIIRTMGRGVLRHDDPYVIPSAAALPLWKDADLAIGIGTRLQYLREWGHDAALKVIRIDLDPAEMSRVVPPTAGICADAAQACAKLVEAVSALRPNRAARTGELGAIKAAFYAEIRRELQPQVAYLDVIREAMADDDVFVDEMTQVGYAGRLVLPIDVPRTYVSSSYQGTLGFGFATALGAQIGAGPRRVISINGDGGFMYTMPELATAVLHNIPLIAIVFSDGNFGNVRRIQKHSFEGRFIASDLHNPDFAALATNFGALGLRAERPEELRDALRQAKQAEGPVLIEVPMRIDEIPSPWRYIHGRKVR